MVASQAYEKTIGVDLAKLVIDEKKAIAERGDEVPVQARVRRRRALTLRSIKWSEVDMDEDRYQLKVFPSSALPSTPSGRTATVEQWIGAGFISREQGMQLLDFPDLESFLADELAPFDIVLDAIERMVEDGEYVPPEPIQNFKLSKDLVSKAYQRHRYEGVPEAHLDLLLRYLDDIDFMEQQAQQAQQAPQQGQPQQVTAQPGPAQPSPQGLLPEQSAQAQQLLAAG